MSNQVEIVYSQSTPTTVELVAPGPQGPTGPAGAAGPAGVGSAWQQGAGVPGVGVGVDGDYYLNTSNGDIYGPKAAGAWGAVIFNIAQGQTGSQGPAGPAGAAGQNGREVQLQVGATHIQWRYVGDPTWINLVALSAITGPAGAAGAAGAAATVAVGTVTTSAAGSSAAVANAGTSGAAVFNFTIPRGDTGATGPQGPAGPAGPSGVANATAPITYDAGTQTVAITPATTAAAGSMSAADKAKLDGVASGATANSTDAQLRDRATHTGTQAASTITGLGTAAALNTGTSAGNVVVLDGSARLPAVDGSQLTGLPPGGVTSIGLVAPTGFSVSGSPITTSGSITLSFAAGYSLPTDARQANWDTAHSERRQWDGGSTGLDAATARTSLGLAAVASSGSASDLSTGTLAAGRLPNTAVTPGSYTNASVTVDATGRITAASSGTATGIDPVVSSMIF